MKRTYYVVDSAGMDLEVYYSLELARRLSARVNASRIEAYATGKGFLYRLYNIGANRFSRTAPR